MEVELLLAVGTKKYPPTSWFGGVLLLAAPGRGYHRKPPKPVTPGLVGG